MLSGPYLLSNPENALGRWVMVESFSQPKGLSGGVWHLLIDAMNMLLYVRKSCKAINKHPDRLLDSMRSS